MSKCKQNDCGWCYEKSGMSNDTNGACLSPSSCAVNNWPNDEHISNVAHNGEVDAPTYKIGLNLYRINPVNNYALVWTGRKWMENQMVTNAAVRLNGNLVK